MARGTQGYPSTQGHKGFLHRSPTMLVRDSWTHWEGADMRGRRGWGGKGEQYGFLNEGSGNKKNKS